METLPLAFIGKEVKFKCQRSEVRNSHIFLAVKRLIFGGRVQERSKSHFKSLYSNCGILCPCYIGLLQLQHNMVSYNPKRTIEYDSKNGLLTWAFNLLLTPNTPNNYTIH